MNLFDQFLSTQGAMKQNDAQDISNQFNLAKLTQLRQDQDLEAKSRQLGAQIAQGNLAKQATSAPTVTLANMSEVPDATAESQGMRATQQTAQPATVTPPKQSELLAQQADQLKQAALKFGAIGNLKQQDTLLEESRKVTDKLYLQQAEERKQQIADMDRAGGAIRAVNGQDALTNFWDSSDPQHRQGVAGMFNLGLDGKPIYDAKAQAAIQYLGDKVMSAKDQAALSLKAVNEQIAQQRAETDRLKQIATERYQTETIAAKREGNASKGTGAAGSAATAVAQEDANLHGAEYLAKLTPGTANVVRKITDYTLDPRLLPQRGNERAAMLANAIQVDPKFDASEYPNRYALKKDFTSGKTSDNIVSIDQAMNHMGTLKNLTDAIGNNDTQAINRLTSFVSNQMGDPNINSAQLATQAVATELMRVFRQVNASEQETKSFEQRLNASVNSPQQMAGALKVGVELLNGRTKAIDQKWNKGMKTDTGYPDLMSPAAQEAFQSLTGKPYRDNVPAKAAATPPAPAGPKVGTVDNGFRFKGGDPSDAKNWEKQ